MYFRALQGEGDMMLLTLVHKVNETLKAYV